MALLLDLLYEIGIREKQSVVFLFIYSFLSSFRAFYFIVFYLFLYIFCLSYGVDKRTRELLIGNKHSWQNLNLQINSSALYTECFRHSKVTRLTFLRKTNPSLIGYKRTCINLIVCMLSSVYSVFIVPTGILRLP